MKRGPKSVAPSTKVARGTRRRDRDANIVEITTTRALPMQPEWLTEAGREAWLDNVARAYSAERATELDSALFGTFCNLLGACSLAWRAGEVPPSSAIAELRRFGELFGLAGSSSRLVDGGGERRDNPFATNGAGRAPRSRSAHPAGA